MYLHLENLVTKSQMSFIDNCDTHAILVTWNIYP